MVIFRVRTRCAEGTYTLGEKGENREECDLQECRCVIFEILPLISVCMCYFQVIWAEQQISKRRCKRDIHIEPTDPKFPQQWYLVCENLLYIFICSCTLSF